MEDLKILDQTALARELISEVVWDEMLDHLRGKNWEGAYRAASELRKRLEDGMIPNILNLDWPDLNRVMVTKAVHYVIMVYSAHKHYGKELPTIS